MKKTRSVIPMKLREEINLDPFYSTCALYGQYGHECEGRITLEHAIIIAGNSYQSKWSIVPLCAKAHDVDQFQDSHNMIKELNEWVALSRASDQDILSIFNEKELTSLSKSKWLFQRKKYLVHKYRIYEHKKPIGGLNQHGG